MIVLIVSLTPSKVLSLFDITEHKAVACLVFAALRTQLNRPQRSQECQKMRQDPLNSNLEVENNIWTKSIKNGHCVWLGGFLGLLLPA